MEIPKKIHQIWSNKYKPLPKDLQCLCDSWKEFNPEWEYIFWDDNMISDFMSNEYPELIGKINSFPYDMQRWDTIRLLIMYNYGGLYVDVDYECFESIDPLLKSNACFAMEPSSHFHSTEDKVYITSALFAVQPQDPFVKLILDNILENMPLKIEEESEFMYCLNTTSVGLISRLYFDYEEKSRIYAIPEEYVSPFSLEEIRFIMDNDQIDEQLNQRIQNAYAVHYFQGTWIPYLKQKLSK